MRQNISKKSNTGSLTEGYCRCWFYTLWCFWWTCTIALELEPCTQQKKKFLGRFLVFLIHELPVYFRYKLHRNLWFLTLPCEKPESQNNRPNIPDLLHFANITKHCDIIMFRIKQISRDSLASHFESVKCCLCHPAKCETIQNNKSETMKRTFLQRVISLNGIKPQIWRKFQTKTIVLQQYASS